MSNISRNTEIEYRASQTPLRARSPQAQSVVPPGRPVSVRGWMMAFVVGLIFWLGGYLLIAG